MTLRPGGPLPPPPRTGDPAAAADLTDGAWHRLHPLTPLLRGGVALIALIGWVLSNLRERLLGLVVPGAAPGADSGDPIDFVVRHDAVGIAALAVLAFVLVVVGLFTLSWRMHTFRVTGEVVEVRSGVLFRNHRKARLDRIQAVNVSRPFLARLVGTARLEISQAGHDANVHLAYLGSRAADDLRSRILLLASGARAHDADGGRVAHDVGSGTTADDVLRASRPTSPTGRFVDERMTEFLAPELDPRAVRATRVVRVHAGRLIGSILLSHTTVVLVLVAVGIAVSVVLTDRYVLLVTLFPAMVGAVGVTVRRFTKSLQYSIAATPDGIRIGYGLVSTANETLPPGRVHAVAVTQPLLWRPFGWWDVRANRASHAGGSRQNLQASSIVLPVGDAADVRAVLEIILPELVGTAVVGPEASFERLQAGSAAAVDVVGSSLTGTGDAGGFTRSPGRGAWLRPLSWRRNGYRSVPGAVLLRLGAVWRSLVLVPLPRVQSVHVAQGPLERVLGLAAVHVHTVHGPVVARIGALAADDAMRLFTGTEADAVRAAAADMSHRWRDTREARHASAGPVAVPGAGAVPPGPVAVPGAGAVPPGPVAVPGTGAVPPGPVPPGGVGGWTAPPGWDQVPRPDGGPR